jgi:hypothetical protein
MFEVSLEGNFGQLGRLASFAWEGAVCSELISQFYFVSDM